MDNNGETSRMGTIKVRGNLFSTDSHPEPDNLCNEERAEEPEDPSPNMPGSTSSMVGKIRVRDFMTAPRMDTPTIEDEDSEEPQPTLGLETEEERSYFCGANSGSDSPATDHAKILASSSSHSQDPVPNQASTSTSSGKTEDKLANKTYIHIGKTKASHMAFSPTSYEFVVAFQKRVKTEMFSSFTTGETFAIIGTYEGNVLVIEVETGRIEFTIKVSDDPIRCLVLLNTMVYGISDHLVFAINLSDESIHNTTSSVWCQLLCAVQLGSYLVVGTMDGQIIVYNLPDLSIHDSTQVTETSSVMALATLGNYIIVGFQSGQIGIYSIFPIEEVTTLRCSAAPVTELNVSFDNKWVLSNDLGSCKLHPIPNLPKREMIITNPYTSASEQTVSQPDFSTSMSTSEQPTTNPPTPLQPTPGFPMPYGWVDGTMAIKEEPQEMDECFY